MIKGYFYNFWKNTETQTFGKGTLFVHPVHNGKGKQIVYPPMFKVFQKLAGQTVFPPYLRSNLTGQTVCPCIEMTFVTLLPHWQDSSPTQILSWHKWLGGKKITVVETYCGIYSIELMSLGQNNHG